MNADDVFNEISIEIAVLRDEQEAEKYKGQIALLGLLAIFKSLSNDQKLNVRDYLSLLQQSEGNDVKVDKLANELQEFFKDH